MSLAESFHDLIERVRQGDQRSAAELVRRYEPAIRRAVRFRLTDPTLRRTLDSMDVCQSVLLSFFVGVASGQYQLDTPEQLLKLLTAMARNKLLNQARHQRAARRDPRPYTDPRLIGSVNAADANPANLPDAEPSPCQHAETRELLAEIQRLLSPEERQLVDLRNQGHDWISIAQMLGGNPATLRQKFHRALSRLTQQLDPENRDPQ